ncbi:MAG: hypothetical protein KJ747_10895 [Actinobacteria bacterium]|nr:hypothetical protein [Actinomycetota bacterium]
MRLQTAGTRVVHEGTVTRVFVLASASIQSAIVRVVAGLLLLAAGVYLGWSSYSTTAALSFGAFLVGLFGLALLAMAYRERPLDGAWTHQFVYDGEAVHCVDPTGSGSGRREQVDALRLVEHSGHGTIVGSRGPLGPPCSLGDARDVLRAIRQSAGSTSPTDFERSRLISSSSEESTSVLPRPGIAGVNPSARAFWPLTLLLLGLPTLVLILAIASARGTDWDSISLMVLALALAGYALTIPFVWYLHRQRLCRSAALLPNGLSFTSDAVRIIEGHATDASYNIIEVPFAALHSVDLLDPDDDAVSRLTAERGVPASGLVLVHGSNRDIIEARPGTRTRALQGVGRTDALQIREVILLHRDRWLAQNYAVPDA